MKSLNTSGTIRELTSRTTVFSTPGKRSQPFLFDGAANTTFAEKKDEDTDRPPIPPNPNPNPPVDPPVSGDQ